MGLCSKILHPSHTLILKKRPFSCLSIFLVKYSSKRIVLIVGVVGVGVGCWFVGTTAVEVEAVTAVTQSHC
eukprot:COSAG01_NODE_605_length_14890_cov_10.929417_8_plen_71_part_00